MDSMFHQPDGMCVPLEVVLRLWAELIGDEPDQHIAFYTIHLREKAVWQENLDDVPNPVVAVSIAANSDRLVPMLLMPWHLSQEVHSSVLVNNTTPHILYVTEIHYDGAYTTYQVGWNRSGAGNDLDAYTFTEPEAEMHLPSWEMVEALVANPRSFMPFDVAINTAQTMLETMIRGGLN